MFKPNEVAGIEAPGNHLDAEGLYLQVRVSKVSGRVSRNWVHRYTYGRKQREMGLGTFPAVGLAKARKVRDANKDLLFRGTDPLAAREADIAATEAAKQAARARKTFAECAAAYIAAKSPEWKPGGRSEAFWTTTLGNHASHLGKLPVDEVTTDHVLSVLEPLWSTTTETATRLRGQIEAVIDYATARKLRSGENPARWRGHLDKLLASPRKVTKVEHHEALPYQQVGAFMRDLRTYRDPRNQPGLALQALEFVVLTAARSGEVRGAKWSEIDLDSATWTVPAERMKAGKEHVVPLSRAALDLLASLPIGDSEYVFPNTRGEPLSDMAPLEVLRRMRVASTVHGFRSSFMDWCAETTNYPTVVADMALAHMIKNRVEAAYRRGDLLTKRRALMEDWAVFCGTVATPAKVTPIREGMAA